MFNNTKTMLNIIQQQTKIIAELTKETKLLNDIRIEANKEIKRLKEELQQHKMKNPVFADGRNPEDVYVSQEE